MFFLALTIDSSCLWGHEQGCITKKAAFFFQVMARLHVIGNIVPDGQYLRILAANGGHMSSAEQSTGHYQVKQ